MSRSQVGAQIFCINIIKKNASESGKSLPDLIGYLPVIDSPVNNKCTATS